MPARSSAKRGSKGETTPTRHLLINVFIILNADFLVPRGNMSAAKLYAFPRANMNIAFLTQLGHILRFIFFRDPVYQQHIPLEKFRLQLGSFLSPNGAGSPAPCPRMPSPGPPHSPVCEVEQSVSPLARNTGGTSSICSPCLCLDRGSVRPIGLSVSHSVYRECQAWLLELDSLTL